MSKRNEPIGEVECIAKGCELTVPVFKFQAREHEQMRRFAGKVYARCPKHGRFGGDPADVDTQEYILSKGRIWGDRKSAGTQPAEPANPSPAVPAKSAEKLPAKPAAASSKAPARPATKKPAAPAKEPAAPAPSGWGYFEP